MPYSLEKQLEKSHEAYMRKMGKLIDNVITLTAEQIVSDFSKTFDKVIDEFYEYETKRYYRHEVGRGTGTGWNLYLANQMRVDYSGKVATNMHLGWNGNDMAPYKSLYGRKRNVKTEHVLDSVMSGVRFDGTGAKYFPRMEWELTKPIKTKYFGTIEGGTPDAIFDYMIDNIYNVQKKQAKKNFNKLFKKFM